MKYQLVFSTLASLVLAAGSQSLYGQCGGQGYSGATDCPSGSSCNYQNPWYSQCIPGTGSGGSPPSDPSQGTQPASSPAPASGGSSGSAVSAAASSAGGAGSIKASFTQYGSHDNYGSGNCNTKTAACGFYTSPGYSAAISQNFYGAASGQGAGPACGECWALSPESNTSGQPLSGAHSIVVKINNLCPATQANPLCSQNGQSGTNSLGANVNFDLCQDSGAANALFGSSGVGAATGTAVKVDCSQWSGSDVKRRMVI